MYLEKNKIKSFSSLDPASIEASSLPYDFPRLIESLKRERSWKKGDLASMILLKSPAKRIVLALLHEGTEVSSCQSDDSTTFRVLEGKINIRMEKNSCLLNKGEVFTLREKLKYVMDSVAETALLLTLETENKRDS